MEGLSKLYEGAGEGIVVFSAVGVESLLGSGGDASKRVSFKVPVFKLRECRVEAGILSIGITTPNTVRPPFKWKLEMEGFTVSREFKPQLSVSLEDSTYHKALYDVKPLVSSSRYAGMGSYTLRALYDSAHPIFLREASLMIVYSKAGLKHSASYMSGLVVLEPGGEYTVKLSLPEDVGGDRIAYLTLMLPSPKSVLNISSGVDEAEIVGPGFRLAEVKAPRDQTVTIKVSYAQPQMKIYPRKALITGVLLVENALPTPRLEASVESVEELADKVKIKVSVANMGEEAAEEVQIILRHAGINVKEVKLGVIEPGETVQTLLEVDKPRLPSKPQKLSLRLKWAKNDIESSKILDVNL
ncbi:MAG: hypothetical protein P3X22_003790 [Thermoprotei archaeon]|nr:hypothetical protein [Thermoprotei archaeon]